MISAYMNWSGGKDSSLCLHRAMQEGKYRIDYLLTSVNASYDRISMHGVRRELLMAQAASVGIPLETVELPEQPDMAQYERGIAEKVGLLKGRGCTHALFGDIFLEDLRRYREEKLLAAGIDCVFPLWKDDTTGLLHEFIHSGFKAIIVCVNSRWLDKSFCGRLIDEALLRDLPGDVDPCGENGEYHSFVFEGPIFSRPVAFQKGEIVYREYRAPVTTSAADSCFTDPAAPSGFYFCDLLPAWQAESIKKTT
ncbi:MAG: ATP-binding protein [Bacteroidota bacterium]|nr:ATP-binding protein [Bacteroidota bacterium]MDP4217296.1 ATP-binding protein [Bacteroidota bacterium]MDP4246165.1 ATP-binding protein [Bacteroidota bacterium]MDP4253972.1 ATP-binding protein [Bacteroidota bacterium]MDP4257990.1 ATP-binding protein [Bacteroidota bacterium]